MANLFRRCSYAPSEAGLGRRFFAKGIGHIVIVGLFVLHMGLYTDGATLSVNARPVSPTKQGPRSWEEDGYSKEGGTSVGRVEAGQLQARRAGNGELGLTINGADGNVASFDVSLRSSDGKCVSGGERCCRTTFIVGSQWAESHPESLLESHPGSEFSRTLLRGQGGADTA